MAEQSPAEPVPVSDDNFDEFIGDHDLVLVDFWAEWCGPCKMLAPTIEELAEELQGDVVFAKLDTDENQQTAQRFGVMSIPTMMIFKDGDRVDQMVGALPKNDIREKLSEYID